MRLDGGIAGGEDLPQAPLDVLPIGFGEEVHGAHAHELFFGVACELEQVVVPPEEPALVVHQVEDPRQAVDRDVGELLLPEESLLRPLSLGDVLHHGVPPRASLDRDGREAEERVVGGAVLAPEPHLLTAHEPLLARQLEHPCPLLRMGIEMSDVAELQDLFPAPVTGIQNALIERQEIAVCVGHAESDGRVLEQGAIAFLALAQRPLGSLGLADVAIDTVDCDLPLSHPDGHAEDRHVHQRAVLAPPHRLHLHPFAPRHPAGVPRGLELHVPRGHELVERLSDHFFTGVAEEGGEVLVGAEHDAGVVHQHHGLRGGAEQLVEEGLLAPQGPLRPIPVALWTLELSGALAQLLQLLDELRLGLALIAHRAPASSSVNSPPHRHTRRPPDRPP
jgi:hypothetical protein